MAITNVSQTSTFEGIGLGPNADGVFVIGGTKDVLYGGDMSTDGPSDGITLISADGDQHFALAVYGDDGSTALAAGWVSTIFGSMNTHAAISTAVNMSAFGVTGQLHVGASINSTANLCGIYGIAETISGVTITAANFFGGLFGATLPSTAVLGSGCYAGGICVSGNYAGTTTGHIVGIHFMNPTSTAQFDAAFSFGQNVGTSAGCVVDAATGGSETKKLKVIVGGTTMYIALKTA